MENICHHKSLRLLPFLTFNEIDLIDNCLNHHYINNESFETLKVFHQLCPVTFCTWQKNVACLKSRAPSVGI